MSEYKEMYISLFQATTRAIAILQEAQKQTEEMYLSEEQPVMKVFDIPRPETNAPFEKE